MNRNEKVKIIIYSIALIYFIFKASFYTEVVGGFPDESMHISYIAYLQDSGKIIPEFKNMKGMKMISTGIYEWSNNTNYLGHPPLYYQIMKLVKAVKVDNNVIKINIMRLRYFNIFITSFALILIFYLCYRMNMSIIYDTFFAITCISVPMLSYEAGAVNNDNLCLLGIPFCLIGLQKIYDNKLDYLSYFFVAIGYFIIVMTKLSAGEVIILTLVIFCICKIYKDKNIKFLVNKNFAMSLPFYIISIGYYLFIYFKYATIQPSLQKLAPSEFYNSGFYVAIKNRMSFEFIGYLHYFIKQFLTTWISIASHISCLKPVLVDGIAILLLPIMSVVIIIIDRLFSKKSDIEYDSLFFVCKIIIVAAIFTVATQFFQAYRGYLNTGYLGGFQSRYYLFIIPAMALLNIRIFQRLSKIYMQKLIISLYIILLIYQDFIYFLIHYKFI